MKFCLGMVGMESKGIEEYKKKNRLNNGFRVLDKVHCDVVQFFHCQLGVFIFFVMVTVMGLILNFFPENNQLY